MQRTLALLALALSVCTSTACRRAPRNVSDPAAAPVARTTSAPIPAPAPAPPAPHGIVSPRPFSAVDLERASPDEALRCEGSRCTISRSLFEKMMGGDTVWKEVRIVPSIDHGKPNGFRLFGIRAGSIVARLGLENGDTLMAIDGTDISTPEKALAVYSAIRHAKSITLSLLRRGAPFALTIAIAD